MNIDSLTSEQLTHNVFKEHIVGLVRRYNEIIVDPSTSKEDLKWLNEELEQLSVWLKDIENIENTLTLEQSRQLLEDLKKLTLTQENDFNVFLQNKTQELNDLKTNKTTELDNLIEAKKTELTTLQEQKIKLIEDELTATKQQLMHAKANGEFDGLSAYDLWKKIDGNESKTIEEYHSFNKATLNYNELQNKPLSILSNDSIGSSLTVKNQFQDVYEKPVSKAGVLFILCHVISNNAITSGNYHIGIKKANGTYITYQFLSYNAQLSTASNSVILSVNEGDKVVLRAYGANNADNAVYDGRVTAIYL